MSTFPTTLPNFTNTFTFHEYNILLNPPYSLNVPLNSLINPRHGRKQNKRSRPPRPSNSWILFRTNFASRLRSQYPDNSYNMEDVSRMAGEDWRSQPSIVKQYFSTLAKLASQWHKETYSDYTFRPRRPKQNKRKNWSFREVDKTQFMDDENNAIKKKQKRRANIQLDNSAQLGLVQQNENKQFQPSSALLSDFVQNNNHRRNMLYWMVLTNIGLLTNQLTTVSMNSFQFRTTNTLYWAILFL